MSTYSVPPVPAAPLATPAAQDPFSITTTDAHRTSIHLDHHQEEHYGLMERVKDVMWDNQIVINTFVAGEHFLSGLAALGLGVKG
jgi:hypothetical protein